MDTPKSQREINREEWQDPNNWSGTWPYKTYSSKRDSRLFASARFGPSVLNLGHRWAPLVRRLHLLIFLGILTGILWLLFKGM